jgi:NAD(P)-dependent dehydrogenase (short-subunit alcohol dehydrogenase family)
MILVTGATGAVGGRVARLLAERGESLRLWVRHPSRAPGLDGAEVVVGDDADPASLPPALPSPVSRRPSSSRATPGRASATHAPAKIGAERSWSRIGGNNSYAHE